MRTLFELAFILADILEEMGTEPNLTVSQGPAIREG